MADDDNTSIMPAIITRAEAKAAGLSRYFTGKPCKHGHVAEHQIGGSCVVCARKRGRARYAAEDAGVRTEKRKAEYCKHAGERKAYSAKYRRENPEKVKAAIDRWRAQNHDHIARYRSKYIEANADRIRARTAVYRAANRGKFQMKDYARYWQDPEARRKASRDYREANLEKVKARQAAYRAVNLEKEKARYAAYYAANREKIRERKRISNAAWREANREKYREARKAYGAAYYAANREKLRAAEAARKAAHPGRDAVRSAKWRSAHPEQARLLRRVSQARRRARIRNLDGICTRQDIQQIYQEQKGRCAYCREKVGEDYHLDHIQPLAKGGSNHRRNIQITCPGCNLSKNSRDPIDFAQSRGLLL